jgi:hypothetical protein
MLWQHHLYLFVAFGFVMMWRNCQAGLTVQSETEYRIVHVVTAAHDFIRPLSNDEYEGSD